jgi:hypothetical protein
MQKAAEHSENIKKMPAIAGIFRSEIALKRNNAT